MVPRERGTAGLHGQGAPIAQVDAFRASSGPILANSAAATTPGQSRAPGQTVAPGRTLDTSGYAGGCTLPPLSAKPPRGRSPRLTARHLRAGGTCSLCSALQQLRHYCLAGLARWHHGAGAVV